MVFDREGTLVMSGQIVQEATGVPAQQLVHAAQMLAASRRTSPDASRASITWSTKPSTIPSTRHSLAMRRTSR